MRSSNYRTVVPAIAILAIVLVLAWAKQRDPFRRVEFDVATPQSGKARALAVLPKPDARFPVVIYVHGSGRTLQSIIPILQQIAELGMAAVGIECNQTNQAAFDEQFAALQSYLQRQPWAQSNAVAWVGMSLGAQRTSRFLLNHPEVQPQLLVRLAGGGEEQAEDGGPRTEDSAVEGKSESGKLAPEDGGRRTEVAAVEGTTEDGGQGTEMSQSLLTSAATKRGADKGNPLAPSLSPSDGERVAARRVRGIFHCPVLLVHGEFDEVFPLADVKRLAALLATNGVPVTLQVLPGLSHNFGENHAQVHRATAEYCRANLPPADYTAALSECQLNEAEQRRFNLAMQRAGDHRPELLKAVSAAKEPERRTLMMMIGGLEDYDLARVKASSLKETAQIAWQARRAYPWGQNTPLDIFEDVTANPRCFEEPIEDWRASFNRSLHRTVKYCRTTHEVSDAIWRWMHKRVVWKNGAPPGTGKAPREILGDAQTDCYGLVVLYTALCRSIGLAERPTEMVRQDPEMGPHFCSEVWTVEERRWRELDSSADGRNYHSDWVTRIAKAFILTTRGERGDWNALNEKRLDQCLNTIGLVYPSGTVKVEVVDGGKPVPHATVGIQIATMNEVASLATQQTDADGRAEITLGRTARFPYRLVVQQPGETAWQWLTVRSNQSYQVVLDLKRKRPLEKVFRDGLALTNSTATQGGQ